MPNRREREFRRRRERGLDFLGNPCPAAAQLHAREQWSKLLNEGDPAKEPEARRLAQQAGIDQVQMAHLHAIHFKHKPAAPVQPAVQSSGESVDHAHHAQHADDRKPSLGSFKGPCKG